MRGGAGHSQQRTGFHRGRQGGYRRIRVQGLWDRTGVRGVHEVWCSEGGVRYRIRVIRIGFAEL